MATTAPHQRIVAERGAAAGRITGMNHIQLVVRDIDVSTRFYRDVLGFKVIRTQGEYSPPMPPGGEHAWCVPRNYFFQLPNGTFLSLIQVDGASRADQSVWTPSFWPGVANPPSRPQKLDHMAFDVPGRADLEWFQEHLRASGVVVSEIVERLEKPRFVKSIYFYDPDGIPLEIATWDWDDPAWEGHDATEWLMDEEPVPALRG